MNVLIAVVFGGNPISFFLIAAWIVYIHLRFKGINIIFFISYV